MSIPQVPHSDAISTNPQHHQKAVAKTAAAAGANKDQFNKVLNNIANAIVSPEEMKKKQKLNKDKQEQVEDGKGMQPEEDHIVRKVRRIKKRLKDLAKFERQNLGL
jgi:hypothetical protein